MDDENEESLEDGLARTAAELEGGDDDKGGRSRGRSAARTDEQDDAGDSDADDDTGEQDADDDESNDEESDDESDESDEEEEEESDDDDESDDDESEDEDEDDDVDPEVAAAAARHQLPTTFEDVIKKLPKEARAAARQAFAARLKEVESGLGRAFQEARAERSELARIKAERTHETENPADHIADLLDADPKLIDKLNEELTKRETAAYRDAKKMTRDQAKKDLDQQAKTAVDTQETRRKRGEQVVAIAQRLARDAGVPFKLVDKALYIAVTNSKDGDVTDEVIRRIVKQEARDWQKLTGERKREKKQEYIKSKTKQREQAKKRVSARDRGHAPAPGRQREPRSLEEALTRRAAKILPDAPA